MLKPSSSPNKTSASEYGHIRLSFDSLLNMLRLHLVHDLEEALVPLVILKVPIINQDLDLLKEFILKC